MPRESLVLEFLETVESASAAQVSRCGAILALQKKLFSNPVSVLKDRLPTRLSPASYIFAAGLLVQLIVVARLANSPFLLPTQGDMLFYDDWARRILAGRGSEHLAFYGLPGYAYALAFVYRLFGYNPFTPAVIQACANAGTGALIYKIAARVFQNTAKSPRGSTSIGILAAAGWAFFEPAQAYSVVLMPTALSVFVLWFVVWQIVDRDRLPRFIFFLLLGLFIGMTATAIATILFIVPLLIAACFRKWQPADSTGQSSATRLICTLLLALGIGIGTAPCWIHNYIYAHDPVFLSAHSGVNFWIGNNPTASGYPKFPPGLRAGQASMLHDSIKVAEEVAGHPLKHSEVSAYWSGQAANYIQHHFAEWLGLLGKKITNFWNAFQYDDLSVITLLREEHVTVPGLRFGLVAALALAACVFAILEKPAAGWVGAAVFLQMCALLPVFVTERYRLPAVPGLLIFAAYGLWWFAQHCTQRGAVMAYGVALVAALTIVARPVREPSLWALDAYNSGLIALDLHKYHSAEKKLELAYSYSPNNSEVDFAMGNLRLAQERKDQAKEYYLKTLTLNPIHEGAFHNLGVLALEEQRWQLAEYFLRQAVKQDSKEATTHFLLAKSLLGNRNREEAREEIKTAIRLQPGRPDFLALREELAQ